MKNIIISILFLFQISCSSTTILKTSNKNTKIFVNGKYLGMDSVIYTDSKVSFSTSEILTQNDICGEKEFKLNKNQKIDYQAAIGSLFFIVPILWIFKYSPVKRLDNNCN